MADEQKTYVPHEWTTGEPITQGRMRNIEYGIADAYTMANNAETVAKAASDKVDSCETSINTIGTAVSNIQQQNEQTVTNAQQGAAAWTQILKVINYDAEHESVITDLGQKWETVINTSTELISARKGKDNLRLKIDDIDSNILVIRSIMGETFTTENTIAQVVGSIQGSITTMQEDYASARGYQTDLSRRLNLIDGNPALVAVERYNEIIAAGGRLGIIESELRAAHKQTGENVYAYANINARFNEIENNIGGLTSNTLNKNTDVVNDLISVNTDKALSANMGKTLKDTIGGAYSPANTVATGITNAANAAEANAKNYTDALLGNGFDSTNTVTAAMAQLTTTVSDLDTNVDGRLDTVEQILSDALVSTVVRTPGAEEGDPDTDTTYNSLDARLEAIESHTTAARTDLNTIAAELAMLDNQNAIKDTNTKIDDLVADVHALASEIAMGQDENGRLTGAETRIDDLEERLDTVDGENGTLASLDSRLDTAEDDIDTLQSDLNTAETGLKDRMTAVESKANAAATATDLTTLAGRVTTLENQPKSATVIIENVTYNNDGVPTSIANPSTDVDYLLKKDDKYYYWKYIKTGSNPDTYVWALISGGSGSGNTSGYDMTAEEYQTIVTNQTYTENTDYYVTRTDGIHHYRYVMINDVLTEIEIGSVISKDNIKKYNMMRVDTTRINSETNQEEDVTYLNLYEFDYGADNTIIDTQSETMHLRAQVELPKGGGGAASTTVNNLIRIGAQTVQTIVGGTVLLRVFYSSWDGPQSNDGIYTLKAGSTTIATGTFNSGASDEVVSGWTTGDGYYEFDVTNYCRVGTTSFTLSVNVNGTNLGKSWSVNVIDLHIESDAPDTLLLASNESYVFPYTPFGALQKTLHVVIDGDTTHEHTVSLVAATSGRANSYTITPAMILETGNALHGAHTIEMYLTANVGNTSQQTDSIIREYIWYDATDTETPVILASSYNNQTINTSQYSTVEIPYQVYKKGADSIDVYYYLDNAVEAFDHVTLEDTNASTLSYLASIASLKNQRDEYIPHIITIKVDNISISVNLIVAPLNIDIAPVSGAIIDFDPTMLSNSSTNRLPSWNVDGTTYNLTASENFNWSEDVSGGGYKEDADGKCFVVKAGSYVDLNYKMFETKNNKNVFDNGAEIKVIFKTAAVRNADAVWFTNTGSYNDKTVGIQLGAHVGWLKTDKASNTSNEAADTIYDAWTENTVYQVGTIVRIDKTIYQCIESEGTNVPASLQDDEDAWDEYLKKWLKLGQIDTEVLSTNSYLYLPYSEKDKIELDININKYESGSANNFIMSYEDGVPSKAYAYTYGVSGDGLTHTNGIRIGSPDCDVYIYHLRIYNKALGTSEILQNFIADGKNIDEKVSRYNKNCIYWDATQEKYFTSPSGTAVLDPIKLAEQLPDVKILMLDTPRFTTGKKDFVKNSTLRCIHAKGGKVYTSRGDADNWFFENGFHAGQGTTSDNYGQSARNVDFLFEVDATHWPTKEKNIKKAHTPSVNYVSSVLVGENATKWDSNTETWVPTSIWDSEENKWVPNEDILSSEEIQNWTASVPDKCLDWKGDECKVDLTSTSVPNNYFNLKVNVASSENVNNALFQERYNEFLNGIYPSPAYKRNAKIKNSMEFVPAILFLRENDATVDGQGNYTKHNEFNDTKWHFYALGNIGDSKKTDYTRAYNPKDMNEFTVENSDNNTNNGQFQSGVFIYNDQRAIETDYPAWSNNTAYTQNDIVVYEGGLYKRTGATQAALGENETYNWVAADWTAVTYTGWTDTEPPYFAPRTNPNPMDYVYPITPSQWNIKLGDDYLNRKHQTLVKEKFDGDHSFEFRYACMGDYRDGDLINDTTGLAKAQENINHQKVLDFYEWLVTATEEEYEDEAADWFVPEAMEFFYAFTHYYTMMDNRAKNTFWHWGKRYISSNDANGANYTAAASAASTAQTAYDEAAANLADVESVQNPIIAQAEADIATADATLQEDPENAEALAAKAQATSDKNAATALVTAAQTAANTAKSQLNARILKRDELKFLYDHADCYTVDNTAAAINDGRRFDLWAYDMDTAVGIDNNGALVFPYGKEDEDYRVEGEASSGYAFNGAGSIFWRRLKNTFSDGIRTVMNNADVSCFNSENLINQFDKFQNCFPEEIWRLDIERKYIRTFTGKSVDTSITTGKQNPRFLTSMMQGRKKYQRRQWVRNQGVYFNSKYRLTDIIRNENTIEFNIITPTNTSQLAVTPDYHLKLTPYQDMYLNVQVGNGNYQDQIRAKAGVEYTMDLAKNTSGTFQETRIYINGFNSISGISNLAPMYPYSFTLSALEHLKVLDLGTDNAGYRNTNFTSLPFEETTQLPLLETLNIKNCNSLTGTIKLNTANNIRTIEAVGSSIASISLPDYTNIQTLHMPSTVSAVSLYGARFLTDFYMKNISGTEDYTSLYTLYLYDSDYSSNIHWIDIARAMLIKQSTGTNLQLLKLSATTIDDLSTLEPISDIKSTIEAGGGTVELSGTINVTGNWSTIERDYYGGKPDSVWPDLEFDTTAGTMQTKHKVTYRYDDYQDNNGQIVTGDTIKILYITDGNTAPDIYSNGTISTMPHRDSTVRESYEFGTIDNFSDAYIPYSGWKLAGTNTSLYNAGGAPIIRNDTVIETFFNTNARTYYVKWYTKEGVPSSLVKTSASPIRYGEGYNLEAPTVAEIHAAGQDTCSISINGGSATYSIFKGWKKLPTNITPTATDETYDIYGDWETGTVVIDDLFNENNLSNLTEIQLLVLSALDTNGKNTYNISNKIVEGTRITYSMGQDSIVPGTVLTPDNPLRLDGAQDQTYALDGSDNHPTIQPLKAGNDAFTLAIDYCFNPNVTYDKPFATLVSCFSSSYSINGTRTGIGLFYGSNIGDNRITGPRVGFGDMYGDGNQSVSIGTEATLGMRNIVVLRHPAGSNTLYIYSGLTNNNNLPSEVTVNTITWANYNTDAYLNFGKLTSETTDLSDGVLLNITNAKGTIFWSKYWNEDLGQGECKRLATWPHEQMTYAISRLNATSTSIARVSQTAVVTPSIYLSALSTPAHGRVVQSRAQGFTTFSGRDDSVIRTICNNRIFAALPTKLQAIMCQPNVAYTVVNNTSNSQETSYELAGTAVLGKDYVFQYSVANLINNSNSKYATLEDQYSHPFSWYNSANVVAYTYSASGTRWLVNNADSNATQYLNIRAPFKAIPWGTTNKLRVFREYVDRIPNDMTIVGTINDSDGAFPIRSGDIYITTNDKAYIYVTNSEIQTLGIQIMPTTGENAKFATPSEYRGGWIPIEGYWTRSAIAANGANFAYATQYGEPNITTVTNSSTEGFRLMYTIAI